MLENHSSSSSSSINGKKLSPSSKKEGDLSLTSAELFSTQKQMSGDGGGIAYDTFKTYYQICTRCTEAKYEKSLAGNKDAIHSTSSSTLVRKNVNKNSSSSSSSSSSSNSDVADHDDGGVLENDAERIFVTTTNRIPILVRKMPKKFMGKAVKSCRHFQWKWCEGIPGNPKCRSRGSKRHDACPKYLASSTFWKHTKNADVISGETKRQRERKKTKEVFENPMHG
jgi:hypothetical protein